MKTRLPGAVVGGAVLGAAVVTWKRKNQEGLLI